MAANPWGKPTITVEKVLDNNPNLHLQNAENALRERNFQDAARHIEYAKQTANGREEILKQCFSVMQLIQQQNSPSARLAEQRFVEVLKAHNFHPEFEAIGENRFIKVPVQTENSYEVDFYFIFFDGSKNNGDKGTAVFMFCFDFLTFPENKKDRIITAINEINSDYGFELYRIDIKNRSICMAAPKEVDFHSSDIGSACYQLLCNGIQMRSIDFPEMMRALWGAI